MLSSCGAVEVREGLAWDGADDVGPYLLRIPFCCSGSGAKVKTTVLCSRLQREKRGRRQEAYRAKGPFSNLA